MKGKNREIKGIFLIVALVFLAFLIIPVLRLLGKSFLGDSGFTSAFYREVIGSKGFIEALGNSFSVSSISALVTTLIAFFMAYTIHYTNISGRLKKLIKTIAVLPMLLPTITYGFAIIIHSAGRGFLPGSSEDSSSRSTV